MSIQQKPKRGDVRSDGRIFHGYSSPHRYEVWLMPESYKKQLELNKAYSKSRHADPQLKAAKNENSRKNAPKYKDKRKAYRTSTRGRLVLSTWAKRESEINPLFRLKRNTRTRMKDFIKRKSQTSQAIIGCSWEELKAHIEGLFTEGMSWQNYGDWHIDHIIPLASAKTEKDLIALFHYTNVQPLWAADNLKKGANHGD
jgi:hypothetical protein